jgi:hypothetical protein
LPQLGLAFCVFLVLSACPGALTSRFFEHGHHRLDQEPNRKGP